MRSIFFDLDGTLIDSLPGIEFAVDSALAQLRFVRTGSLRTLIGPPISSILQSVAGGATKDQLDSLEAAFRAVYDATGWQKTAAQAGAGLALDRLRAAGIRLFLVTNKPLDATGKILGKLGLRRHFDDVLARNPAIPGFASKAQMLRCLLDRHALNANDCLMVGDTLEDAAAAAEVGVKAAIMAHGYGTWKRGAQPGCHVLNDFSELTLLCGENR